MSSICTIREKELESVVNVAKLFVIAEHQSQGVSLSTFNGQRQWIFEGEVMDAMIIGGPANFAETFVLPLRLICDGEIQAHLGNESVELTITDDVARLTGTEGFSEMTLLSHVDTFKDFDRSDLTTATIRAYNLFHLINLGTALPTGFFDQQAFSKVHPFSKLKCHKDSLEVVSEFKEINGLASQSSLKAEVAGRLGEVTVNRYALKTLNTLIGLDDLAAVTISCNVKGGEDVLLETPTWKARISQQPTGVAAYFDYVVKWLTDDQIDFKIGQDGKICAKVDGEDIEIQLLDRRLPIIRCTIKLVTDVEYAYDLLRELDEQNQHTVCTKFFIQDGAIVSCLDLVAGKSPKLANELHELVSDSILLGDCLSSLSVIGEKLDLQ